MIKNCHPPMLDLFIFEEIYIMKKILLLLIASLYYNACLANFVQERYDFDNFKGTPLWALAQAVRTNDGKEVKLILKSKKLDVDFKDSKFQQTLLALSIQNKRPEAFIELLKAGADPNIFLGKLKDETALTYAINTTTDCDLYYVDNLLKHGANPNLEIKNPTPGYFFESHLPLILSIYQDVNCLKLIQLLVDNGADINCHYKQGFSNRYIGVIDECLLHQNMKALKYFVIQKQIKIPDTLTTVARNEKGQRVYSLKEILRSKDFELIDFEDKNLGMKFDKHEDRDDRDEILAYLDKIKK